MIARFDNFEIDTTECRISREGETIRLARQPLDLLILLIERRGKLVTREEIASALWGGSAFVDAEHGINNAIRKIRDALGDDPSNPRWIETVVRRGYRFKAPAAAASLAASEETPGAPALAEPDAPVQAHPSSPTRAHRRLTVVAVGIAAMALSLFAIGEITTSSGPGLRWTPLTRATRVHTNLPLAADTRFVYWTEYNELGCRPMRVPLAGGDPLPVPMPFPSAFVLDSDSGGRLLVNVRENCKNLNAEGAVWELDAQTGSAHRVGDLTAQAGGFSADGGRIVLARGRELWTAAATVRARNESRRDRALFTLPGGRPTVPRSGFRTRWRRPWTSSF